MAPSLLHQDHSNGTNGVKSTLTNGNGASFKTPKPDLTPGPSIPEPMTKMTTSHLDASYKIVERPIGTRRRIRVVCMGAGYSGLMMAMVFSQRMKDKNAELVIYERNEDLGGTWLENRYVSSLSGGQSICDAKHH